MRQPLSVNRRALISSALPAMLATGSAIASNADQSVITDTLPAECLEVAAVVGDLGCAEGDAILILSAIRLARLGNPDAEGGTQELTWQAVALGLPAIGREITLALSPPESPTRTYHTSGPARCSLAKGETDQLVLPLRRGRTYELVLWRIVGESEVRTETSKALVEFVSSDRPPVVLKGKCRLQGRFKPTGAGFSVFVKNLSNQHVELFYNWVSVV